MIAPSWPVTMTRTTLPLAQLRASAHKRDTDSIKLMNSASFLRQWPQANLSQTTIVQLVAPSMWLYAHFLPPKLRAAG